MHAQSLRPRGLWPARLLCPWDSPGENTGLGCHVLLRGVFPTQGLNHVSCMTGRFFTAEPPVSPLVSWPGIKPRPPAMGVWSLSHWATREVPSLWHFFRPLCWKRCLIPCLLYPCLVPGHLQEWVKQNSAWPLAVLALCLTRVLEIYLASVLLCWADDPVPGWAQTLLFFLYLEWSERKEEGMKILHFLLIRSLLFFSH